MASVFVELDPGAHAVFGGGEGAMTVGAMTAPTSFLVRSLCDLHALFAAVCFAEQGGISASALSVKDYGAASEKSSHGRMNRRGNILEALIATAQNYTSSTRWMAPPE